jgi:PLP dependent protein
MDIQTPSLTAVRQRIAAAETRFNRSRDSVVLLAVSKTRTPAAILAVARQSQRRFAENYLQEALPKIEALASEVLEWHFIGRLQSNKTEAIARHFDWVHTLDRAKIATRLNDQRPSSLPPLNVLVQVNIDEEPTKSGISLDQLPALIEVVMQYPQLRLRGLMALPAPRTDFEQQRMPFRRLAKAWAQLRDRGIALDTLSMGTSEDFEAAIAEGATLLRIGTAIFGPRQAPP